MMARRKRKPKILKIAEEVEIERDGIDIEFQGEWLRFHIKVSDDLSRSDIEEILRVDASMKRAGQDDEPDEERIATNIRNERRLIGAIMYDPIPDEILRNLSGDKMRRIGNFLGEYYTELTTEMLESNPQTPAVRAAVATRR